MPPAPVAATANQPVPAAGPLAVALGLLAADAPGQIMRASEAWPRWAVLLPHVLAVTGHLGSAAGQ